DEGRRQEMKSELRMTNDEWARIPLSCLFHSSFVIRHWSVALLLFCLIVPSRSFAQVWDGGGADNNWSTITNWNPNAAPANNGTDRIIFSGSTRLTPNVDVNWDVLGIIFSNNASAFTLSGNQLTIRAVGITNNSASLQTINNALVLATNLGWSAT